MFAFDSAVPSSDFARCLRHDPVVLQVLAKGGSAEDVVVALCQAKDALAARVSKLEMLAPSRSDTPSHSAFRASAEHLLPA